MANVKTPKFETKIHLPEIAGSFTFRKNGKCRLDQQVKKFCLLNKSRGCFELKVHFGRHVNPDKINYDAKQNGIAIDTLGDQRKYKLFVPYPNGLKLSIPSNPEAQFFCGVLSAKLAIIKYDKSHKNTLSKTKKTKNIKTDKNDNDIDDEKNKKMDNPKKERDQKRNKRDQKRKERDQKRKIKPRKLSLHDLNKRIAKSKGNNAGEPPKKRQKLNKKQKKKQINSNEMTVNDQHELIDGVVDQIEEKIKKKRQMEVDKDADINEYLRMRADKKKMKEQKRKDLREKFNERRKAKTKFKQSARKKAEGYTRKKVTFAC